MNKELPIIFTKHAWERINELKLNGGQVKQMIKEAEEEKNPNVSQYKKTKYGNEESVRYYRHLTYIFTMIEVEDKFNPGKKINLLITMADQRTSKAAHF